jgi:RNA polymerase sigma factor (sigma-70 family)
MTPRLGLRGAHERTLESLYRRHAADVYRYALMMLDSPADAEDVTQTTFLNAYRALLRGERPRATGGWLRSIAHNLCLQHFRQASRRPREVELEADAAELVTEPQGILVDDLSRALRQIPVNQRAALLMRELEGRPIAEIATILGVSTSAVETLLFRARRGVREQLEGGLTCAEAEQAISRQLDGQLQRAERGALRAHLRECEECARLARSLRAQRGAIKSLRGAIPLPGALAWSKFGAGASMTGVAAGGGAAATGGAWFAGSIASKLVTATILAAVAAGAGYVAAVKHPWSASGHGVKAPVRVAAIPAQNSAPAAGAHAVASRSISVEHAPLALSGSSLARGPARAHGRRSAAAKASRSPGQAPAANAGASAQIPGAQAVNGKTARGGVKSSTPHKTHRSRAQQPKHTAHGAKPAHPAKPAYPAKPAHPAKPASPAKPTPLVTVTQTTTSTTTTPVKHPAGPSH